MIVLGALAAFTVGLSARGPENHDVPRYTQMAVEMRRLGTWMPVENGRPYHEAMPLAGIAPRAVAEVAGGVTPGSARLLPALSQALTTLAVLLLVRRHAGPRAALLAAGAATLDHLAWTYGRSSRVDAVLGASVAVTLALFLEASSRAERPRRWGLLALAGLAAAVGVAAKGPLAGALVAAALVPWLAWERRPALALEGGAIGTLVAAAATAAWLLPYRAYLGPAEWEAFLSQFLGRENLEKWSEGYGKEGHALTYFVEVWWNAAPWIAPAAIALWRLREGRAGSLERLAACWMLGPMVLLSLAAGKHARYLVPVMPAIAILAGLEIDRALERRESLLRRAAAAIAWALGGASVLAGPGIAVASWALSALSPLAAALGAGVAAAGVLALRSLRRGSLEGGLLAGYASGALGVAWLFGVAFAAPSIEARESPSHRLALALAPVAPPAGSIGISERDLDAGSVRVSPSVVALELARVVVSVHDGGGADPRGADYLLTASERPGYEVVATLAWSPRRSKEEMRLFLLRPRR